MNTPRWPRRSYGAAGAPNQTEMQAIVQEEVQSPMESKHKIESYVLASETQIEATSTANGTRWCQQFFHTERRRLFHTFMAKLPNLKASPTESIFFPTSTFIIQPNHVSWLLMKVVLRGQKKDALRSTLWEPATPQNLQGLETQLCTRSVFSAKAEASSRFNVVRKR